jgi:hypothetical protein
MRLVLWRMSVDGELPIRRRRQLPMIRNTGVPAEMPAMRSARGVRLI